MPYENIVFVEKQQIVAKEILLLTTKKTIAQPHPTPLRKLLIWRSIRFCLAISK